VVCMRDMPGSGGVCQILDDAPVLDEVNDEPLDIFFELLRTSKQIQGEKKTTFYVGASEFNALCEIRDLDPEDKKSFWAKALALEEVWNNTRPANKRPKGIRKRVRRN
jgi:hypothetical protein